MRYSIILLTILILIVVGTTKLSAKLRSPTSSYVATLRVQIIDTIDTSKIAVLQLKALYSLNDSAVAISLTSSDYLIIDSILKAVIAKFNLNEKSPQKGIRLIYSDTTPIQLKHYYQQYIPFSLNFDRIVFVNCFKETMIKYEAEYWKKSLVLADGGGKSFFRAEINLSTKTCLSFGTNAPL